MALGRALKFIENIKSDNNLRARCYKSDSKTELLYKFGFNEYEFDDAINMKLIKCQSFDEAEIINEIKLWFALL